MSWKRCLESIRKAQSFFIGRPNMIKSVKTFMLALTSSAGLTLIQNPFTVPGGLQMMGMVTYCIAIIITRTIE